MKYQETREAVLQTCRTLADRGFLAGTGGNVALRADASHFAVTPSATDYYDMSPVDICVLRLDDLSQLEGDSKPSVESGLHANVLRSRPDCNASVHTHQPIASAYTLLARPLEVQDPEHRQQLGATVPCAGYAPSGTSWLAGKVAKCIRPNIHAYLMRNHGVVCVGSDADCAIERVETLELACANFFLQQLSGRKNSVTADLTSVVREALQVDSRPYILEKT